MHIIEESSFISATYAMLSYFGIHKGVEKIHRLNLLVN